MKAQRQLLKAIPKYETYLASGKRRRRKPKYVRVAQTVSMRWSARPILRAELEEKLSERMAELLTSKLAWSHSKRAAMAARVGESLASRIRNPLLRFLVEKMIRSTHMGSGGGE
jgi:hypothetical protein